MKSTKNVVVGGGIIGLLAAWYLAKAGESTVVVDRQSVGRESSWAGGGILSPLYPSRYPSLLTLAQASLREYPQIVREIRHTSGIDPELIFSGLLVLDPEIESNSPDRPPEHEAKLIAAAALTGIEPHLRPPALTALYYKTVAQVRNPRLIAALRLALAAQGVRFIEDQAVTGFLASDGRLIGIETDGGYIETDRCIVAAGAWTAPLLHRTGLGLPIKPIRGQMIVIKAPPALIRHIIVYRYHYLIPRSDGRILVGSTVEDVNFDNEPTPDACMTLRQVAISLVPSLAAYPVEHHWAGLRPGTPDGIPFIGEHPGISGLFVCAGHHRNGFATGPASAALAVDLVLRRRPVLDPTPYRLDRPAAPWTDEPR